MNRIDFGDCRATMRAWAADGIKAQMCVTSPPYYGLRDYGHEGQIGLEETPEEFIANLVETFRCVRDVLADDGTLWVNIGDSYNSGTQFNTQVRKAYSEQSGNEWAGHRPMIDGLKKKDLIGIPWMLAFALRADGWYLRQDIIWHKPNPMPESVTDRCTKAHEYVFLLSKSERYFFDSEAIREEAVGKNHHDLTGGRYKPPGQTDHSGSRENDSREADGKRNRRSVWTVATRPYKGAHFATFPPALIEPCILAGSRPGDIVLDPFMGSGTTAATALQHGRQYLGCELNPEYGPLQEQRIAEARAAIYNPQLNLLEA